MAAPAMALPDPSSTVPETVAVTCACAGRDRAEAMANRSRRFGQLEARMEWLKAYCKVERFGRWKAGTDSVFAVRLLRVETGCGGKNQSVPFSAVLRASLLSMLTIAGV